LGAEGEAMFPRFLLIAFVVLAHAGFGAEEIYKPIVLSDNGRQRLEREERELLRIEETRISEEPFTKALASGVSFDLFQKAKKHSPFRGARQPDLLRHFQIVTRRNHPTHTTQH
jgi:hypothetical protein